jgi:hypothetical protein
VVILTDLWLGDAMSGADVAVIVESFNETEHSSVDRLAGALDAAQRAAREHGSARVVLADGGNAPAVARLIAERFPDVDRVPAEVYDYDHAKRSAATAADAKIVVYLDGDCRPHEGWLPALLEPIESGRAIAAAGFTTYEGGWLARVLSVMDFGFLLPREDRPLGCYSSNNAAFATEALVETPAPDGDMRCRCFAHAQLFERKGTPIHMAPDAAVQHEEVPFFKERMRRGWDLVTAARIDPDVPEARWLPLGVRAAPRFMLYNLRWDVRRVLRSGGDMGLGPLGRLAAIPVMGAIRMLDLVGIVAALRGKPVPFT